MDHNFIVTFVRFHRSKKHIFVLQGYFENNTTDGSVMSAQADGRESPLEESVREGLSIRQKYFSLGVGESRIDREYDLWITLPDRDAFRTLRVFQTFEGKRKCVYRMSAGALEKMRKKPDCYLETWREEDGNISIGGWAVGASPCRIRCFTQKRQEIPVKVTWHYRPDIAGNYPEIRAEEGEPAESFGFDATFKKPAGSAVTLVISSRGQVFAKKLFPARGAKNVSGGGVGIVRKTAAYLKRYGVARTLRRSREKMEEKIGSGQNNYMRWRKKYAPSRENLREQRLAQLPFSPLISIVVPLYKTKEQFLKELVDSIRAQTYENWELCLSDGSGENSPLDRLLAELESDPKIRVIKSAAALGIADNTNAALSLVRGEYVAFADHDDLIAPDALYEFALAAGGNRRADFFYSDEDKVSMDGKTYFQPHFKPDYSPDLLCSVNYICTMVMVKRELLDRVGMLDKAYDGAQDYDFVLRCLEQCEGAVHIAKPLYHWRSHQDSTAENPESKRYAFEAGKRAVQAHLDRLGIRALCEMGPYPGLYRIRYLLPEKEPLISVIIPNKDHIKDLETCVRSLDEKSAYRNFEIIVAENNSTQEETFAWYEEAQRRYPNLRVLTWKDEFNFSLINNFAAQHARGEYLLFLNNDTEAVNGDLLGELLGPCLRGDVGAVGARLLYPDRTVQHAGVVIGYGGIAGHAFAGSGDEENGYFSRSIVQCNYSAVTAACMMVRKTVFFEIGGFDGELKVAFNDIDFCLRLRESGRVIVYNPYARMIHYESKSRGYENTPEKIARFNREANDFLNRWKDILKEGDPYYNPNLSLDRNDFALKK